MRDSINRPFDTGVLQHERRRAVYGEGYMNRVNEYVSTAAGVLGAVLLMMLAPGAVHAQWVTKHEQSYLSAAHNWEFRNRYQAADRLFNAFDYGHAILYETLLRRPRPVSVLEEEIYNRLTRRILVAPPRLPVAEAAVAIRYAQLAPEAMAMFDWAHVLHRQVYDVWADESIPAPRKDDQVMSLLDYYRSRADIAFSSQPKSMTLMQEQPYSLAFRRNYPKFNGLIWAYHWLQIGLYEPLLVGRDSDERQALVRATVARFWQMLADPPRSMPHVMPMTAAVAPNFAERYPELAIIFDNLHSMHDVISDILANPEVSRNRKRTEILRIARLYRDDTSHVMPVKAWRTMAREMGVENQGGQAVGFLPELPTPTVTYGAAMRHDDATGRMTGMLYGEMLEEHTDHERPADPARPDDHEHHEHMDHQPEEHEHAAISDSASVVAVVNLFHQAMERGDSAGLLELLVPSALVLESGAVETVAEYRAHHLPADMAFAGAVHASRRLLQLLVHGDVSWVVSTVASVGEFRGRPVDSEGVELMVLARTPDGWRITAIHWSSRRRN